MLDKIEAIRDALDKECYLPALALALTLPDICSKVEYPLKKRVGSRYKEWFDKNVEHFYANNDGWNDDFSRAKSPYFTGEMCYALRNSFLHSGNYEDVAAEELTDDKFFYHTYLFELNVLGCDSASTSWTNESNKDGRIEKKVTVSLDVVSICNKLCLAAENFLSEKGKENFTKYEIKLIGSS